MSGFALPMLEGEAGHLPSRPAALREHFLVLIDGLRESSAERVRKLADAGAHLFQTEFQPPQ